MSIIYQSQSDEFADRKMQQAVKDLNTIDTIQNQLISNPNISLVAQNIIKVTLESLNKTYTSDTTNLALESNEEGFMARAKQIAKKIIQAILDTINRIISIFNKYKINAKTILSIIDRIEQTLSGHVTIKRRDVFVNSQSLATSLFVSRGGGNLRDSYKKVIDLSTQAYGSTDYDSLERILNQLKTSTDEEAVRIKQELLTVLTTPIRKILGTNIPPVLSDKNTKENSDMLSAGPFLGEKYIYAFCPRDTNHMSEFGIGMFRNMEAILPKTRLPALSTNEIWDICKRAKEFAELIINFDDIQYKINKLSSLSKDLINNTESIKSISAAAIYPAGIRGLHYTVLDMGVESTFAMLDYCHKSIIVQTTVEK